MIDLPVPEQTIAANPFPFLEANGELLREMHEEPSWPPPVRILQDDDFYTIIELISPRTIWAETDPDRYESNEHMFRSSHVLGQFVTDRQSRGLVYVGSAFTITSLPSADLIWRIVQTIRPNDIEDLIQPVLVDDFKLPSRLYSDLLFHQSAFPIAHGANTERDRERPIHNYLVHDLLHFKGLSLLPVTALQMLRQANLHLQYAPEEDQTTDAFELFAYALDSSTESMEELAAGFIRRGSPQDEDELQASLLEDRHENLIRLLQGRTDFVPKKFDQAAKAPRTNEVARDISLTLGAVAQSCADLKSLGASSKAELA